MRRFILIIAVSEYQPVSPEEQQGTRPEPLPGVLPDAERLRATLQSYADGGVHRIVWLRDGDATRQRILEAIREIADQAGITDQVVVYFAGHGWRVRDARSNRHVYSLLPYDAVLPSPHANVAPARALSTDDLGKAFEDLHASELVVILDCCHSGGIAGLNWTPEALDELLAGWRSHYVMAAACGNQRAGEDDWGGFFTRALCEALEGEGVLPDVEGRISAQAAWARAADVATELARRAGHEQKCVASGHGPPIYLTRWLPRPKRSTLPIRDFTDYIEDKTRGFVGRQFVFDGIERFVREQSRGYFIIRGDPGIGKSALSAYLVRQKGYLHHFNIQAQGINKAEAFLKNICSQLIATYNLNYDILPPEATTDSGFLGQLLRDVSGRLAPESKTIIVVDALDEVDNTGMPPGTNPLYLPPLLPAGIYIVVTSRRDKPGQKPESASLRIDCEQQSLYLEQDSKDNIADIRDYIEQAAQRKGIQRYIEAQAIDEDMFVGILVEKSQGNFMYLRYILPEIENGAYRDLELNSLPVGLRSYYQDHWRRMHGQDEQSWRYKEPIVLVLAVVREPIPIDLIADFSGIQDRRQIQSALQDWLQFLYEKLPDDDELQSLYRVYHASYQDFIQEEVGDEAIREVNERIARQLLDG